MKQFQVGCFGGIGLGLLMILCPWVQQGEIERNLTQATKVALEERGFSNWDISFSGLDATLRGPESESDAVRAVVARVPGVALVQVLSPEREAALKLAQQRTGGPGGTWSLSTRAEPGSAWSLPSRNNTATTYTTIPTRPKATAPPTPAPTPAPTPTPLVVKATPPAPSTGRTTALVQLLRHEGTVYVRGVYPTAAAAQAVVQEARKAFGAAVTDETSTLASLGEVGWTQGFLEVLPALRRIRNLELALGGDVVILSGSADTATAQAALAALQTRLPQGVSLENRLNGSAGAAPPSSALTAPERQQSQEALNAVVTSGEVRFATASSRIQPVTYPYLDRVVARIGEQKAALVVVGGHTDNEGDPQVNQHLSQKRADAVRAYLIARGIPAQRCVAQGYGAAQPIASNATEEGRRRNRRITFTFR